MAYFRRSRLHVQGATGRLHFLDDGFSLSPTSATACRQLLQA
jgi:hypothetical protein